MDPDHAYALPNGVLMRVMGRRNEAIAHLQKAAEQTEHPDAERSQKALERILRGNRTL